MCVLHPGQRHVAFWPGSVHRSSKYSAAISAETARIVASARRHHKKNEREALFSDALKHLGQQSWYT